MRGRGLKGERNDEGRAREGERMMLVRGIYYGEEK